MPNHVQTEIITSVDCRQFVINADGNVDFGILLPKPINIFDGSYGQPEEEAFGEHLMGMDWARRNWGTKWNAYGDHHYDFADGICTIRFQTAWNTPRPWILALFNTIKVPLEWRWLDEGQERTFIDKLFDDSQWGVRFQSARCDDDAIHYHMHNLLWGCDKFEDEDDDA